MSGIKLKEELLKHLNDEDFAKAITDIIKDPKAPSGNKLKAMELFAKYAHGTPSKQEEKAEASGIEFNIEDLMPEFEENKVKEPTIIIPDEEQEEEEESDK